MIYTGVGRGTVRDLDALALEMGLELARRKRGESRMQHVYLSSYHSIDYCLRSSALQASIFQLDTGRGTRRDGRVRVSPNRSLGARSLL
jgi:hypothetical protein